MTMTLSGSGTIGGLVAGGLPDATIVQADLATNVAGNGPAFSAYQSSAQTISAVTFTKIQLQTEEFDTNNCFDSTTNYRFTPNVAGYYQINGSIYYNGAATCQIYIYKNGTLFKRGSQVNTTNVESVVSALVYFNGTTDYVELYGYHVSGATIAAQLDATYFQASMVRAA